MSYNPQATIKIEVSLGSIAQKFAETLCADNPHAEQIVDTVISCLANRGDLSYLYNSLNGFTNGVNFQVGQRVWCNDTYYGDFAGKKQHIPMGNAVILEINEYGDQKIRIQYTRNNESAATWVYHSTLEEAREDIATPTEELVDAEMN